MPVNDDATVCHIVQTLYQLHESGLAGTGVTDEADAFSRRDANMQIPVKRRGLTAVTEGDVFESDFARVDMQRPGTSRIRYAKWLAIQLYHLLHFIYCTLQLVDLLSDVA